MEAEIIQLVQTTVEEVISKAEAILNSPYMLRRQRNNGISTNVCKSIIDEHDSIEICARERIKGEEILELDDPQMARAHWIQLFKMNMQMTVIQNTFLQILSNYQHLRPIWCFARNLSDKSESCFGQIRNDKRFIQHCENVLAAMNAIMENLDEPDCRDALLQQLGVNHFFYDVCEPHFEVFHSAFNESMRTSLHGTDALNENLEQAWNTVFEIIKSNMCVGLSTQRYDYLSRRMTPKEFIIVKSIWHKAKVFDTKHLGAKICQLAIQLYNEEMLRMDLLNQMINLNKRNHAFMELSQLIIDAIDTTLSSYSVQNGFIDLPHQLHTFVHRSLILGVCPSKLKKSFIEALTTVLISVVGNTTMNHDALQAWNKIGRVLQQAIIADIVEY